MLHEKREEVILCYMIKRLDDFEVYKMSMELSDEIWDLVVKWNYFNKDTIGKQLVRSADSISANLSEGFGRYHYRETKNFSYYSRGSLFETKTWLTKAFNRSLIKEDKYNEFLARLDVICIKINNYIKTLNTH
jgi:four helix bundle protein